MPDQTPPGAVQGDASPMSELGSFRANHPPKTGTFAKTDWTWCATGSSHTATFILPPEPGFAAPLEGLIDAMSRRQRVIAPDIPPVPVMRTLTDGLAGICRTEGVTKLNVVGFGFGGVIAQCLAQRAAGAVNKVVLVNTTTPEAWIEPADRSKYNSARLAPGIVLRKRALAQAMSHADPKSKEDKQRWKSLLRECLALRQDKWELLSLRAAGFDAQREAIERGGWSLPGYEGRIQIIESANDKHITPKQREALKAACPSAHVRKIADAGHWLGCVDHQRLVGFIDTFLNDVNIMDRTPSRG